MAVTKAQHGQHTSMIAKVAKFFGPRKANASGVRITDNGTYSSIPGVGLPYSQMPKAPVSKGNFPFATKQNTFGVPGAK